MNLLCTINSANLRAIALVGLDGKWEFFIYALLGCCTALSLYVPSSHRLMPHHSSSLSDTAAAAAAAAADESRSRFRDLLAPFLFHMYLRATVPMIVQAGLNIYFMAAESRYT